MACIISVVNQKGGVGKTTTSVNLAAAIANLGHKVLLIDFDPQAHSTEHTGTSNKFSPEKTILEVLNQTQLPTDCIIKTYKQNLYILPANLRLGQFNQKNPEGNQFQLKNALQTVQAEFDYILIDCQPSLSLLTLNALTASNKVLLPVQAEFFALDGLSQLIITFREVKNKLHPDLSILGVVLTMFDKRNKLSSEIRNELAKSFGPDLFEQYIPRSVRFAEAPSFGKTIFEYAPGSEAAKSYQTLAEQIIEKLEKEKAQETKTK